jgi:multiple sugar transport system permease protein
LMGRDYGRGGGPRRGPFRAGPRLAGLRHRKWWGDPVGYLFIAPAVLLFLLFNGYPIVRTILMSFQHYVWTDPNHVYFNGLFNYRNMLTDPGFHDALLVSLKVLGITLPVRMILAMICAVFISRVTMRMAAAYRVILWLPYILPVTVTLRTWVLLYNPLFGYPGYILSNLGLNPPDWLNDPTAVLPAFDVALVWEGFGFATLIFLIGIYNISPELLEAASVDGAGAWRQFWSIVLPLLRPMILLVLVVSLMPLLQATSEALNFVSPGGGTLNLPGGPGDASTTLGLYVYNTAFKSPMNLGYASAMNMTLLAFGIVVSLIVFKTMRAVES